MKLSLNKGQDSQKQKSIQQSITFPYQTYQKVRKLARLAHGTQRGYFSKFVVESVTMRIFVDELREKVDPNMSWDEMDTVLINLLLQWKDEQLSDDTSQMGTGKRNISGRTKK